MTIENSPDRPAPLHVISGAIADWIARLGAIWVEGQVVEARRRSGTGLAYLQVRDIEQDVSVTVVASPKTLDEVSPAVVGGSRIVMFAKPEFWSRRGQLVLRTKEIRAVGLGDLLARIELLKRALTKEGLFAAERKRALPFLPRRVGLVCGRQSAAERDVIENACRRWPSIRFETREVPVQGARAAAEIATAVAELDSLEAVDVIVVTRGGGSVEDLLPFSDEALVRAVAACRTPVVSAVGHEQDTPLLDLVADVRASTPTDAARRIVPDLGEQQELVNTLRGRSGRAVDHVLAAELRRVEGLRRHPALADPSRRIAAEHDAVVACERRGSRALLVVLRSATERLEHQRARLVSVSPAGTLRRGYAIVTAHGDGRGDPNAEHVIRDPAEVRGGQPLLVRVAGGSFDVVVTDERADSRSPETAPVP